MTMTIHASVVPPTRPTVIRRVPTRVADNGLEVSREPAGGHVPLPSPAAQQGLGSPGDLAPGQTAQKLIEWCMAKSLLSVDRLVVLGLMAGFFIALGGAFFTAVVVELSLSHGPSRLLGG